MNEESKKLYVIVDNHGTLVVKGQGTKKVIVTIPKKLALPLLLDDHQLIEWKARGARTVLFVAALVCFVACLLVGLYEFAVTFDKIIEKV